MNHPLAVVSRPPATAGPAAAVLAPILRREGEPDRLLLIKRPDTMPTHAGHLAFPGGRPDPADHGPVDTALRETDEEVGIPPDRVDVIGFLPAIHTVEYSLWVVPVVGIVDAGVTLRPSAREVARILTPSLDELADDARWRSELWRGRRVWFYDIDTEVLWGATAAMTRHLLGMDV